MIPSVIHLTRLPHPIPYQGSKRSLAARISAHVPRATACFFEPFAGSAAMTLFAAYHGMAKRFVVGDSLEPIVSLWRTIVGTPVAAAQRYEAIWSGQTHADLDYFNRIRDRYNALGDPIDLLYLICRCVKNSVRFNAKGRFTQSVDRRRLGMHPRKMRDEIAGASTILRGKAEFRLGDWMKTLSDASQSDFIYLDPPYFGTTVGKDKRYHQQVSLDDLTSGLSELNGRGLVFALSYDGTTGEKSYGPDLSAPPLGLTRLLLPAGRSSQATLNGISAETVESLYLSTAACVERDRTPENRSAWSDDYSRASIGRQLRLIE